MSTPSFKLDSLEQVEEVSERGIWIDITDPVGRPLKLGKQDKPFRIKVAGTFSRAFRAATKLVRSMSAEDFGVPANDEAALEEARDLWRLAACTLEWEAALDDNGKVIPLTQENARLVYKAARFVYNQVDVGMWSGERFFPASSPAQ